MEDNYKPSVNRRDLYPGMKLGYFTLVQRVNSSKKVSYSIRKRWRVECVCSQRKTIPESYLVRKTGSGPTTHCGCQNKSSKTIFNSEYRIWAMMQQRTSNPKHRFFKYYGGRGIRVCVEWADWKTGFDKFLAHIGPRPSPGHSVDRIDVDGNYEPGNVRWATASEQANNTQAKKRERALQTKTS